MEQDKNARFAASKQATKFGVVSTDAELRCAVRACSSGDRKWSKTEQAKKTETKMGVLLLQAQLSVGVQHQLSVSVTGRAGSPERELVSLRTPIN